MSPVNPPPLTVRRARLLITAALILVLLVVTGDPVVAEVSDPTGDVYIGP